MQAQAVRAFSKFLLRNKYKTHLKIKSDSFWQRHFCFKSVIILDEEPKKNDEPLGWTLGKLLRTRLDGRSARARDETFGVAHSACLERFANGRSVRA
jgi:hypothetical protein